MSSRTPELTGRKGGRLRVGAVLFAVVVTACSSGPDVAQASYRSAREFFYGAEHAKGYLVSSWDRESRAERIRLRRAGYGLTDDWEYVSEDLAVKDLGNFEYFFRYSIWFKSSTRGQRFIREESYYSIGDELWEPVPLTTMSHFVTADGAKTGSSLVQALWRCDFDAFLEDRNVACIRRESPAR